MHFWNDLEVNKLIINYVTFSIIIINEGITNKILIFSYISGDYQYSTIFTHKSFGPNVRRSSPSSTCQH